MNSAPWLNPGFQRIVASAEAGHLVHALIVHASPGWGEKQLVSKLAAYFLGIDSDAFLSAGGEQVAHQDLFWLQPEAPGKQIKVDQIRSLRNFALQTTRLAGMKVAVVIDAHMMNLNAANALLKTLEEPPGNCLILLSSNAYQALLPTIRSRCQSLPIQPLGNTENVRWIKTRLQTLADNSKPVKMEEFEQLFFEFGNAPMFVLEALERGEKSILPDLASVSSQSRDISALVQSWAKQDVDILLSRWMRYVSVLSRYLSFKLEPAGDSLSATNLKPLTDRFASANSDRLIKFWEELSWARRLMHSTSNINRNLLLERLLHQWCALLV